MYLTRETDPNDPETSYFSANETAETAEDGDDVAIYELQEVKTKRVTHTLD
jgi:hypothetical protein